MKQLSSQRTLKPEQHELVTESSWTRPSCALVDIMPSSGWRHALAYSVHHGFMCVYHRKSDSVFSLVLKADGFQTVVLDMTYPLKEGTSKAAQADRAIARTDLLKAQALKTSLHASCHFNIPRCIAQTNKTHRMKLTPTKPWSAWSRSAKKLRPQSMAMGQRSWHACSIIVDPTDA
eukprot:4991496-Amphidinium_carterae.2